MRRIARTGKSKNNDEIQGSFTPFRMTTRTKNSKRALGHEFLNRFLGYRTERHFEDRYNPLYLRAANFCFADLPGSLNLASNIGVAAPCNLLKTFHVAIGMRCEAEIETEIEGLGVVSDKRHSLEILQVRVLQNATDQPRSQALPSSFLHDVNIAEVGIGDRIGDHPGQTDLPAVFEKGEAE
jgi:hypothetical protein